MSNNVGILWAIYIIVIVIAFIIFWLLLRNYQYYCNSVGYGFAFFIASILGAIAVFISVAWVNPNQLTSTEKIWLSVLFIIAFLLPIFTIIYIIWVSAYENTSCTCKKNPCECKKSLCTCKKNPCECKESLCTCKKNPCECKESKIFTEKIIQCDRDTGQCYIKKEKIFHGNDVTKIIYS